MCRVPTSSHGLRARCCGDVAALDDYLPPHIAGMARKVAGVLQERSQHPRERSYSGPGSRSGLRWPQSPVSASGAWTARKRA